MNTIYKYKLEFGEVNQILIPEKAEILYVGTQYDAVYLWALVNTGSPNETRIFRVYGSGHEVKNMENLKYVGTTPTLGGRLVLHIFEEV